MTNRMSDAARRADLGLAGALFLSLATAAAVVVYIPSHSVNGPAEPKFRPALLETTNVAVVMAPADTLPPAAPAVIPAPRPANTFLSRLKINMALENLAGETSCLAEALYYEAR